MVFAYFLLRQRQPDLERPYRLPEFMKWVALGIGVFFAIVWLLGGIFYSNIGNTLTYYLIGIGVLLLYIPLYYYRTKVEDKRVGGRPSRDALPSTPSRRSDSDPLREVTALLGRRDRGAPGASGSPPIPTPWR